MSRIIIVFLFIFIFMVGISLGSFNSLNKVSDTVQDRYELSRQIQDIVIEQVQARQNDNNESREATTEITPKISPYAKIIIEKYFKKCGHTTVNIIDVPKELINYTEEDLKNKYSKWEIKSFRPEEVSIYREIDANCSSHFVIKDEDGFIAVFSEISDDVLELKSITDIEVACLRDEDQKAIYNGIRVYRK